MFVRHTLREGANDRTSYYPPVKGGKKGAALSERDGLFLYFQPASRDYAQQNKNKTILNDNLLLLMLLMLLMLLLLSMLATQLRVCCGWCSSRPSPGHQGGPGSWANLERHALY